MKYGYYKKIAGLYKSAIFLYDHLIFLAEQKAEAVQI